MRKNIITLLLVAALFLPTLALAAVGDAPDPTGALGDVGTAAGINTGVDSETQLYNTVGLIINIGLGLLGIIFLVIALYAGFTWMTAGGDSDKVTKARQWLTNSILGLIIILSAYAISSYVISAILEATAGA